MAMDARVRKTREKLSAAIIELLKTEAFEDITPAKLCELAGVNRSTFYRNYKNPLELKEEIEESILNMAEWGRMNFDPIQSRKQLEEHLRYVVAKKETFAALNAPCFTESIFCKIRSKLFNDAMAFYPNYKDRIPEYVYEYCCAFYINGLIGVIRKWYEDGMLVPVEQVAEQLNTLLELGADYMRNAYFKSE